jgi:hypothetical protein
VAQYRRRRRKVKSRMYYIEKTVCKTMKGVNVATDSLVNYADLIVSGKKYYETRNTNSLKPYIGKRVGIIETKR